MEGDPKPDREGYLDFKLAVDEGDFALHLRAAQEWQKDPVRPQTTLAHYFQLLANERKLDSLFIGREHEDQLVGFSEDLLEEIRDDAVRQKARENVSKRLTYWWIGRFRASVDFLVAHESEIRAEVAMRQRSNPGETEAQSWFWAKLANESDHIDYLYGLRMKAERDIKHILDAAGDRDRFETRKFVESFVQCHR